MSICQKAIAKKSKFKHKFHKTTTNQACEIPPGMDKMCFEADALVQKIVSSINAKDGIKQQSFGTVVKQ